MLVVGARVQERDARPEGGGNAGPNAGTGPGAPLGPPTGAVKYRARVFYHWRKPEEKERHGFSMGVVQVEEKTGEAVIRMLQKTYPQLAGFVVEIDKVEWR
jgi:hypothetical protein